MAQRRQLDAVKMRPSGHYGLLTLVAETGTTSQKEEHDDDEDETREEKKRDRRYQEELTAKEEEYSRPGSNTTHGEKRTGKCITSETLIYCADKAERGS